MPRPHLVVWSWDAGYNSRLQPREWLAIIRYVISHNTSPLKAKVVGSTFIKVCRAMCGRLSPDFSWSHTHDHI